MSTRIAAISLALLLGFAGASITPSSATTITVVLAESLIVRDAPNGRTVWTLTEGQAISVYEVQGDWAHIFYWVKGDGRDGWVPRRDIGTQRNTWYQRLRDCASERQYGAEMCVEITNASTVCVADADRRYLKGCEIAVEYTVESDYQGEAEFEVAIEFDIELEYDIEGMGYWKSNSQSAKEALNISQAGSVRRRIELTFDCNDYGRVTDAQVGVLHCEIKEVILR